MSDGIVAALAAIFLVLLVGGLALQAFVQFSARGLLHAIHYETRDDGLRDFTAQSGMGPPRVRSKGLRQLARGNVHVDAVALLSDATRKRLSRVRLAERTAWIAYGIMACGWVAGLIATG